MSQSHKILNDHIKTYTAAAQQLVALLSSDEREYFMALLAASHRPPLINKPSREFQIIINQFANYSIEKKEEGTTTFADLLAAEIIRKPAEPTKRCPVSSKRSLAPLPPTLNLFNVVPHDATKQIFDYSDGVGSVINLTRSCKQAYSLFRQTGTAKLAFQYFSQALEHAAVGKWGEVNRLVAISPDILLCTGSTKYCGRYYYQGLTIYQIGLKNDEGDNIHLMMQKHFKKLPNGPEEMAKQYLEIFPEGKRLQSKWDINIAKKLLDKLIEALCISKCVDEDVSKAHKNYSDYINTALVTSREGLICDPKFFEYIIEKYIDHHDSFTIAQCIFYGVKIWDDYVSKLPTGTLRAMCQGLCYVIGQKEPLRDSGCVLRTGQQVLPFRPGANFIFSQNFIEMYYGCAIEIKKVVARAMWAMSAIVDLQALCKANATAHQKIYAAIIASAVPQRCQKQRTATNGANN